MGSFFALCIPSDLFFYFSLILYRYYEDFKIDLRTGEANLTQINLQVLFILALLSNTHYGFMVLLYFEETSMTEGDSVTFILLLFTGSSRFH